MYNECSTTGRFLKNNKHMKDSEDYYNEEDSPKRNRNNSNIEPIDWDCM